MATRSYRLESEFSSLDEHNYDVTSPQTTSYNCIAWAAGDDVSWWWPDQMNAYHWPDEVPREETLEAFIKAFKTLGYRHCEDGELEDRYEKIAIYAQPISLKPEHAARQLPDGTWSSKMGTDHDIMHKRPENISGKWYGIPAKFMRRSRR